MRDYLDTVGIGRLFFGNIIHHLRRYIESFQPSAEVPPTSKRKKAMGALHPAVLLLLLPVGALRREQHESSSKLPSPILHSDDSDSTVYQFVLRMNGTRTVQIEHISHRLMQLIGYQSTALVEFADLLALVHIEDRDRLQQHMHTNFAGHPAIDEYRLLTRHGDLSWVRIYSHPERQHYAHDPVRIVGVIQNITDQKTHETTFQSTYTQLGQQYQLQSQELTQTRNALQTQIAETEQLRALLHESQTRYRAIEQLVSDMVYAFRVEEDGRLIREWITSACPSGSALDEIHTISDWSRFVYPQDLPIVLRDYEQVLTGEARTCEFRIIAQRGDVRWIHNQVQPVWDETQQRVVRIYGAARDVTDLKGAEAQIYKLSLHDVLTGLPNRTLFLEHLAMVVQHGACAVLFIDLDDFKIINDSLGHLVGDQFLVEIARRLKSMLPDDALIGRFGGDEFIIVLENAVTSHTAIDVAERIHAALDVPLTLTRREVMATASIGVAVLDHPNMHPEVLLRNASMAMYQAKMRGRAQTVLYDVGMYDRATERLQLETDLRRAIAQGEMCVFYQPIVRLTNGDVVGFEALTRWQHPQRGLVFPGTFIPVAESSGLIIPLGRRVIDTVCRQIAAWQRNLDNVQQLVVNVNISGREFVYPDLVESIAHSLQANHLDARHLELEITETVAMDHAEMAAATLRQLRSLGLHVALDDFGTGYSSLRYLQQFPIQTIKIDASFVSTLTQNEENIAIVEAIISLAHTLGMTVVAEGIETREQLSYLQHLGCDYGQGFFFSKAVDSDMATDLLVRGGYSEMFLSRAAGTRIH